MGKQEYSSKDTSTSVVNRVYKHKEYTRGSNILDYGGGKFDKNIEYMREKGCHVVVYDPYNRSNEYNKNTIAFVNTHPINYIVCSNVLNVIKEDNVLAEVLTNIARIQKKNPGCKVHIAVYEGDGKGKSKETTKGWQRNLKTKDYVPIISNFLHIVSVKDDIIVCD